jgi:hypothetical protein
MNDNNYRDIILKANDESQCLSIDERITIRKLLDSSELSAIEEIQLLSSIIRSKEELNGELDENVEYAIQEFARISGSNLENDSQEINELMFQLLTFNPNILVKNPIFLEFALIKSSSPRFTVRVNAMNVLGRYGKLGEERALRALRLARNDTNDSVSLNAASNEK